MNKSIIVYGPQGCGKTRYAERMRKHFGLDKIVDEFQPHRTGIALAGVLYLTNDMRTPKILAGNASVGMVFRFVDVADQINQKIARTEYRSGINKPTAPGVYNCGMYGYAYFDGADWGNGDDTPDAAVSRWNQLRSKGAIQVKTWCGLAEEPIIVQGA